MKFIYLANTPQAPANTVFKGVEFKANVPVEVEDESILAKLMNHPCFVRADAKATQVEQDEVETADQDTKIVSYQDMLSALAEAGVQPKSRKKADVEEAYAALKTELTGEEVEQDEDLEAQIDEALSA